MKIKNARIAGSFPLCFPRDIECSTLKNASSTKKIAVIQ
jgi:hypothetical protein